jgi:hypothetical protein
VSSSKHTWRSGGCHCGVVRFEAALPQKVQAQACNCSMCQMVGFIHIITAKSRFRITVLLSVWGEKLLQAPFQSRRLVGERPVS